MGEQGGERPAGDIGGEKWDIPIRVEVGEIAQQCLHPAI